MKTTNYFLLLLFAVLLAGVNQNVAAQSGPPYVTVTSPNGGETAVRGQNLNITWADNLTSNVIIELCQGTSSVTCTPIQTISASAGGNSLSWYVPTWITPAADFFIKISRSVNPTGCYDVSNLPFTISAYAVTPSIVVTAPAAGVTFQKGTNKTIAWTDNIPENVKVEYKKASVGTWNTIEWSTPGGSLSWYVPDYLESGTDYQVRVSSVNDGAILGLSGVFTISAYTSTPTITFLEPVANPTWAKNTLHTIRWNDNLPEGVNVEYRKGVSGSWNGIAWQVPGGTQNWYVPDYIESGNDYYIKISSSVDPTNVFAISDAFTVASYTTTPTITLTAPNSGFIQKSQFKTITWTDDVNENLKIDLYKDGVFFTNIAGSVSGNSHNWYVNDWIPDGTTYRIKISSVNDAGINDESNADLEISSHPATAAIAVTSPTATTEWLRATPRTITWTKTDVPENVKIDLYKGGVFQTTIAGSVPGLTHSWYIPDYLTEGNDYTIKISSVNDALLTDESDPFWIRAYSGSASITVTAPAAATEWLRSEFHTITWNKGSIPENVKIELFRNGTELIQTISGSVPGSSHSWYINDWIEEGANYSIRVTSVNNPGITGVSGTFKILAYASNASITVTAPTGNPTWQIGTLHQIQWHKTSVPENVKIELFKAGGFITTIAGSVPNESHNWYVNNWLEPGTDYTIKVTSVNNAIYTAESAPFSISVSAAGAQITNVTTTGTPWLVGSSNNIISWTKTSVPEDVKIVLINQGTAEERVLTYGTPGTTYNWYIPTYQSEGSYKVKVISTVNSAIEAISGTFTISLYASGAGISAVTPVGAPWQKATTKQITWVKTGVPENVSIDLYKGAGFITTIAGSVTGQSHYWYIPDYLDNGGDYKIKVASVNNPATIYAESALFTITTATSSGTISNVTPLTAIYVGLGTNVTLSWSKTITENVNVDLLDMTVPTSPVVTPIATYVWGTSMNWYVQPWITEGDRYVIKISSVLNSENYALSHEFHIAQYDLQCYPNPVGPALKFMVKDETFIDNEATVELLDKFGVKVFTQTIPAGMIESYNIPTESLANGIYYAVISAGERRITKPIVVQH